MVSNALHQMGVTKLDGVIITHTDGDHAGGAWPLAMSGLEIGGRLYPEIDGSLIAAPSWARFMQQAGSLYPGEPFADPPGNLLMNPNPSPTPSESDEAEESEEEETAPKPSATAVPRPTKATPTPPAAPSQPAVEPTAPESPEAEAGGAVTPSPGAAP